MATRILHFLWQLSSRMLQSKPKGKYNHELIKTSFYLFLIYRFLLTAIHVIWSFNPVNTLRHSAVLMSVIRIVLKYEQSLRVSGLELHCFSLVKSLREFKDDRWPRFQLILSAARQWIFLHLLLPTNFYWQKENNKEHFFHLLVRWSWDNMFTIECQACDSHLMSAENTLTPTQSDHVPHANCFVMRTSHAERKGDK